MFGHRIPLYDHISKFGLHVNLISNFYLYITSRAGTSMLAASRRRRRIFILSMEWDLTRDVARAHWAVGGDLEGLTIWFADHDAYAWMSGYWV